MAVLLGGGVSFVLFRGGESASNVADRAATAAGKPARVTRVYYAIGDSLTFGKELGFFVDESGYPKRSDIRFQGWPDLLGYMLTKDTGVSTLVLNKGHPGDRTTTIRKQRLADLPRVKSGASKALVLLGTNDSNEFKTTPSGEGCMQESCARTFRGELLEIVGELQDRGHVPVYVATIPPVWGPSADSVFTDPFASDATRNQRILEFNRVIRTQILTQSTVLPGPDLFSCLLAPGINRFSLFEDHMHPNTLGYVLFAALWRDAIGKSVSDLGPSTCLSPVYLLESLDPYVHGHKQNLLEAGDRYYTDEDYVLLNVPEELADGIWVLQANYDRNNADTGFLEFDAGDKPVSVYIAYDPAGAPPASSSHDFMARDLSTDLAVSDSSVGTFDIVVASGVTGIVSIGGNKSGSAPGEQQAYIVIVSP